jgi:para-aminobenzoate synthetase component 1
VERIEMNKPLRQAIPYHPDSAQLFAGLLDEPWPVFIDSGRPYSRQGRYDILAADPFQTLVTRGALTQISDRQATRESPDNPLQLLRLALGASVPHWELPFCGGAMGYWGYDLARRFERLPVLAQDEGQLPEMAIGIYDWALVVDHEQEQSWLVGQGRDPQTAQRWEALVGRFSQPQPPATPHRGFKALGAVRSNMSPAQYAAAFERIQRYIRDGDCYQVNFAQRFEVAVEGDPWLAYQALRTTNPAPFGAYLGYPFAQILSSSPERFLQLRGDRVETRPIKGTVPRSMDPERDKALALGLCNSSKNRAENLMIVDLLRNDLGKSCVPGSIEVPRLFEVESFATVHHLVSTVIGRLAPDRDALDLLCGCFPGGSITGAPKLRAMEIIEELEPCRRGIYCGAIGYLGFDGEMDSNIVIRTLIHERGRMRFWAGGGIVADSVMEEEYRETFYKAEAMLRLLQGPDATGSEHDRGGP